MKYLTPPKFAICIGPQTSKWTSSKIISTIFPLVEKPHFATCFKQLKVLFATSLVSCFGFVVFVAFHTSKIYKMVM
jgi:hypothetical protein